MNNERREFGKPSSLLERIHTRTTSIKIKEDRLEAEKRQAADEIRRLIESIASTLPSTALGEVSNLKVNESPLADGDEAIVKFLYDPKDNALKLRTNSLSGPVDYNIDNDYSVWLRDGEEIAQELINRRADVARVT